MNNHLLSQFFNVDEEQLLAAAESFAAAGPQIWPASNPVYVKMEDSGDDASSNASSWGFPATSTTPMDYDDAPATINCIPGGLAQISLPGSSRSPSPDMTLTLPGGFNFAAASQQQKPVSALPAHLRPREMALNPSSLVSPSVIPTPLQQQQQQSSPTETQASNSKSNGRKLNSTSSAAPSPAPSSLDAELSGQPHPYSISPSNTTALFTRASSVSSNTSGPTKKGRAPPSGPISTKDFVPPDVSGLSKREARLVKNRAAAFLSRQRKREEFEGLEARVEVLETDNARLYKELEAYRSGGSSSTATAAAAAPAIAQAGATPAALQAELVGLRRQLGARDQELAKLHGRMQALNAEANAERERAAQKEAEIAQLKRQLASRGVAAAAAPAPSTEDSDSDSEDAQSTTDAVSGKKDLKSAGSMAFMVLLFSLSSLLTSAESSGSAKPPVASERVRRPGMHHRDSSRTYLDLPQQAFSSGLAYDTFLSTSDMMLSPSFGFDEDNLLGGSSAFAGLTSASTPSPTRQPQQQQKKTQDNHVADSIASGISGVKSISPEEFEFDFTVPSTSSSSLDCFTFPARPQQQKAGKKIRVCVKSALPLNLNLDALSKAASTSVAGAASQKAKENDVFTSSFGYRVPETDDLLGDSGFWSAAASTFGGSSSPSSVLSPTMSTASSESRKRKRVVVEINPRGASRRRLSEETNDGDDEMDTWDVKFSEDDDLVVGGASFDEDVQMRL